MSSSPLLTGCWELPSPTLYHSSLIASECLGFKTGSSPTGVAVLPSHFPSPQPLLQTKRPDSSSAESEPTPALRSGEGDGQAARQGFGGAHRLCMGAPGLTQRESHQRDWTGSGSWRWSRRGSFIWRCLSIRCVSHLTSSDL